MKETFDIARRELSSFFTSPVAFIFYGTFLAVNLFIFFWVRTFFARNIADVRPLFEWMPVLLIFLCSAITMRMWAEERRNGTLEFLITSPVSPATLVMGKFLACMVMVTVALVLTFPLPVTVSMCGNLDWGPVAGGYLATIFLAAAYISMGLFASSRSENQIVSLILATLLCTLFYLPGSDMLTGFFGNRVSEILKLAGTGSRFESITRGVLDLRDIIYYVSLSAIFMALNIYSLERIRWTGNPSSSHHRQWTLLTALAIANLVALNLWLRPVTWARIDMTEGHIYSISDTTRHYLSMLREPLLIRGYFSARTHPLLAPLVPRLRDLMTEYEVAGKGKVRVEFVDPAEEPEMEEEAGQKYGIRPVPFQTASKYQTAITNSYFDILIKYGDQFETLNFRDLIEVKAQNQTDIAVDLKNPEYDITRTIKKVLYGYQGSGNLFDNIQGKVVFTGYISPDKKLPETLVTLKKALEGQLEKLAAKGGGKFEWRIKDPDANDGSTASMIRREYGFRPMAFSILDTSTFWFYMIMENGDRVVQVPLPEDFEGTSLERAISTAMKRFATGFLKTIAVYSPPGMPPMPQYGFAGSGKQFQRLKSLLEKEHALKETDLKSGYVPEEADILLLLAPDKLDEKQLFAVDQFLMQGGTVIVSTSSYDINFRSAIAAVKQRSGLEEWLEGYGINIGDAMVLDRKNSAFPVPVQRSVGGFVVQETRMIDYPFFPDIREDGMNSAAGMLAGIGQVTMTWSSPVTADAGKNGKRKVTWLLKTSPDSWLSSDTDIQPNFKLYPDTGFNMSGEKGARTVAIMVEGGFDSWFAGKPSPLAEDEDSGSEEDKQPGEKDKKDEKINRVIEKSPDSSRLIVFASNVFLTDTVIDLESSAMRSAYTAPLELVENAVDWSLEDRGLLAIRGRGHFSRPLVPMTREEQMFREYMNYGLAAAGLLLVWIIGRIIAARALGRSRRAMAAIQDGRS
jgi:ABC-2 type transport system permease protein